MSRARNPSLAALAAVVVVLALAPAAHAQQAPTLGAPTQTAPPVTTTTAASDRGLKTWQELLIFGAGIVLLGGIAIAIIGDARDRAPTADRRAVTEPAGPKRHRQRDKDRAREKARTARAQRKRNRKR